MNRLLWFALGGAMTLVSGVVYLAMRDEKPRCTSPGLPEGYADDFADDYTDSSDETGSSLIEPRACNTKETAENLSPFPETRAGDGQESEGANA